jgi:hypothetical protein
MQNCPVAGRASRTRRTPCRMPNNGRTFRASFSTLSADLGAADAKDERPEARLRAAVRRVLLPRRLAPRRFGICRNAAPHGGHGPRQAPRRRQIGSRQPRCQGRIALLLALSPHLERFIAQLFGIADASLALARRHDELAPLYAIKRKFVQRSAVAKYKAPEALKLDGLPLEGN